MTEKNMLIETENRVNYIDIFKGVGILLMIMGHVEFGIKFDHFIHGFHMQIFFFISGFLFANKAVDEIKTMAYIKKKAKKMLLPYCIWGTISYLVWRFRWKNLGGGVQLRHLLFENTSKLPISGALWFLTAFFITSVLYFCLNRYIKDARCRSVLIFAIALAGNIAPDVLSFRLPYAMDAAFVGVGLFHIGYLSRLHLYNGKIEVTKKTNMFVDILLAGVITILIFKNGNINMRTGEYANILLFWINSVGASLIGLNICIWLSGYKNKMLKLVLAFIKGIGRNSIIYLCLNQLALWEVRNAVKKLDLCLKFIDIKGMVYNFVVFAGVMILLSIADRIISGTKLKWCFGQ